MRSDCTRPPAAPLCLAAGTFYFSNLFLSPAFMLIIPSASIRTARCNAASTLVILGQTRLLTMSIPSTAFSSYQTSQPSYRGRRGAAAPSPALAVASRSSSPAAAAAASASAAATSAATAPAASAQNHALPSAPTPPIPVVAPSAPIALASSPSATASAVSKMEGPANANAPKTAPQPLPEAALPANAGGIPAAAAASAAAESVGSGLSILDEMRAHCYACQRNYKDSEYRIYGKRCFEPVPFYYDPLDKIFHREFREGRVACCMIQVTLVSVVKKIALLPVVMIVSSS